MPYSNYAKKKVLNHLFRGQASTPAPKVYLHLYVSDPTASDTGTAVSGGAYVAQEIIYDEPVIIGDDGVIQNSSIVTFPEATSAWGTITHYGIRDAQTGGNLIQYGAFSTSQDVLQGNQPVVNVGKSILRLK